MNEAILVGTDLTKTFDNLTVVKGATIAVGDGEFVSLVGKSGCGKTTLLSLLSGLERPTSGSVTIAGKEISTATEDELALFRRQNVGFIFQSFNLIPTLTAWENAALPLFPVPMAEKERRRRAAELLEKMELGHRMEHLPATLSGGEKQRVAIARALLNNPKIVFADEPTGNLDTATGEAIMAILNRLHREAGVTLLMVTHDTELADTADRVVRMQDGELLS